MIGAVERGAPAVERIAVLVVDDEPAILDLLKDMLSERAFEVWIAKSHRQALKILAARPANFGLLVADINLGLGGTGFDIAHVARRANPSISVVYISGSVKRIDWAAIAGAVLFPKPFNVSDLGDLVDAMTKSNSSGRCIAAA
jgi:DNA-binding NtrC family response regulator